MLRQCLMIHVTCQQAICGDLCTASKFSAKLKWPNSDLCAMQQEVTLSDIREKRACGVVTDRAQIMFLARKAAAARMT